LVIGIPLKLRARVGQEVGTVFTGLLSIYDISSDFESDSGEKRCISERPEPEKATGVNGPGVEYAGSASQPFPTEGDGLSESESEDEN